MGSAWQDLCSSRSLREDYDLTTTVSPKISNSETHKRKTSGMWCPAESRRPDIGEAPVFTPTEEEFKDTIGYIASIRPQAEKYGICRIIPPSSWRPPCPLKDKRFWGCPEFTTRVQQVDKLQNREPTKKKTRSQCQRKRKRRKRLRFGMAQRRGSANSLENFDCSDSEEKFGFQSGLDFTLEEFQKYADEFKQQYFGMRGSDEISLSEIKDHKDVWQPSVEEIEGEYWRIVVEPTDEVEVHYGADLDTAIFSTGFPKLSSSNTNKQDPYVMSGWNLNNLPRLPGSVLSFEKDDISGVLVPWLYVGMCLSSFCWHVEDHHLYSLNYMHFGEPKVWYGIPGGDAVKLEEAMRKHLPELFEEQPDLLHELVTQLSPSVLISEGVPVYRAVQNPGEFVLTLPRAYHSGFNCGFNCAEAVNVAPVDWLPHGQCAVELYREQRRKASISHDKLLLETAHEAIRQFCGNLFECKSSEGAYRWQDSCGKSGVLTCAVKARVQLEHAAREAASLLQQRKMDKDYGSSDRECFSCFYDLHLSAASCECSPNRFACFSHLSLLCTCEPTRKLAFFRYSMEELMTLVAALEGDPVAMCRWGQEHLGLVLPSSLILPRKTDLEETTEFPRSLINVNIGCGFDNGQDEESKIPISVSCSKSIKGNHCLDFNKPVKLQQGEEGSLDIFGALNIEHSTTGATMKEDLVWSSNTRNAACSSSSTVIALNKHEKDKMVMDYEQVANKINNPIRSNSECGSSLSLNHSSELPSPSRIPTRNSTLASKSNNKLFGFEIQCNLSLTTDGQTSQPAEAFSSHTSDVSRPVSWYPVEPLDFGAVMSGKKWCNKQAIFPKGFRSRVAFYSVLDPRRTCSYISEVLDAGFLGPLFRVTLEEMPEISFTGCSPVQCWDSVRDRVNEEIIKQRTDGKPALPELLSSDSVYGLEMFGFSFPPIIQVIEALDPHRQCLDYWLSKSVSPVKELTSEYPKTMVTGSNNSPVWLLGVEIPRKEPEQFSCCNNNSCTDKVRCTLGRLFKKANLPELMVMNKVLSSGSGSSIWRAAAATLQDEIKNNVDK